MAEGIAVAVIVGNVDADRVDVVGFDGSLATLVVALIVVDGGGVLVRDY